MQISLAKQEGNLVNFETIEVNSIDHLAKLICTCPYSLSTFKDGYRNKANFIQTGAIGLDFDEGLSLAEAEEVFKDYLHIIAPTRSHRIEKNGKVEDRFRVVLFLSDIIQDSDVFEATWYSLKEKWPWLDKACKDASRFFYPSQFVYSISGTGLTIAAVAPKPREIREVDLGTLLPGDRGRLSESTIALLQRGELGEGLGRNQSTFKAAKDFQQNLYTFDETLDAILAALNDNGTIVPDFTEAEVENTVRSAFSTEPKHEPRIRPRAFKLVPISEMYKDQSKVEWLVDELLMVGGFSLVSADPKAGKSTVSRQLVREILRGGTFFERRCKQGPVFYFGMEEHQAVLNASFKRLGIQETEPLLVHVGDVLTETGIQDLREILCETKPALAVVDTLFDLVEVESENNYGEIKRKLKRLRQIARDSGTHIMAIHHNSKGGDGSSRRGNGRVLGSQAIIGAMDAILVIEMAGKFRKISSSGREVKQWFERLLIWDEKTKTYSLGPEQEEEW